MSKYINANLIKALMKNDRLMQGNAESIMWQQEVERRVDRLPSIDTEFIDFLFNVINPNEMEEYISTFKARAEQTEPSDVQVACKLGASNVQIECDRYVIVNGEGDKAYGCIGCPSTDCSWK